MKNQWRTVGVLDVDEEKERFYVKNTHEDQTTGQRGTVA